MKSFLSFITCLYSRVTPHFGMLLAADIFHVSRITHHVSPITCHRSLIPGYRRLAGLVVAAWCLLFVAKGRAENAGSGGTAVHLPRSVDDSTRLEALGAGRRGVRFLLSRQLPDGSWGENPAVTSLAALALLNSAETDDPAVAAAAAGGVTFIVRHLAGDPAEPGPSLTSSGYPVLATAVGMLAVVRLDRPADRPAIQRLRQVLLAAQCRDVPPTDPRYGGFRAAPGGVPDLATTDYVIEALHLSDGLDANVEQLPTVYQKAADFVSRCQHLTPAADQADSGWFAAMPAGVSDARALPPRSRAYLTCIGLKSLLYARIAPTDRRIALAGSWLEHHFSLQHNPESPGNAGYFTYLHTLSRTLLAWERSSGSAAPPFRPAWRRGLAEELLRRQRADGSWHHESADWWENRPELATAYALLALELALP